MLTDTFTITTNSTGDLSVISSDNSIITISLSGNTATVTAKTTGSCTITINVASSVDGNYLNNSRTLSVTCTLTQPLANYTPAQIQSIVSEGKATTTWAIGDTTDITLVSRTVGSVTLSGTYKFAILGIDHNNSKELPPDKSHSIHLGLSKNESGKNIAFTDWTAATSSGGYASSNSYFVHNISGNLGKNNGGWASSNMRTNICASFLNCLPSEWRNVITAIPKYTDNTGGPKTDSDSTAVTATTDKIWIMAEWEVCGVDSLYANKYEKDSQEQYAYYKNGNNAWRYGHQQTNIGVNWWSRSTYVGMNVDFQFCIVYTDGRRASCDAKARCGFVPCFAICG